MAWATFFNRFFSAATSTFIWDNSYSGTVRDQDGTLLSSKQDGFGLDTASVAAMEKARGGVVKFEHRNSMFHASAAEKQVKLVVPQSFLTIVMNREGEVSSCDVPFIGDPSQFNRDYIRLTEQVHDTCQNHDLAESMVIGTSAITSAELDGAVGMYSGIFNNPFMIWGKYQRRGLKTILTVSFQFHHTQMDGVHAGKFLKNLQRYCLELHRRPTALIQCRWPCLFGTPYYLQIISRS